MRPILIILILCLIALQYKLWLGDGSVLQWIRLEKNLKTHQKNNERLARKNRAIEADIIELKHGEQSLEEQARYDLGMIKNNETYYQFID